MTKNCDDCMYHIDGYGLLCKGTSQGYCDEFKWRDSRLAVLEYADKQLRDAANHGDEWAADILERMWEHGNKS